MIALECTFGGCTAGEGGAKYRTQALAPAQAMDRLKFHREYTHGRQMVDARGGANSAKLAKIPSLKFQCSDGHIFNVERDIDGQYVTIKFEEDEEVVPQPNTTLATVK